MQIVKLYQKDIELVRFFTNECKKVGYNNNSTLEDMKWGDSRYDLPDIAHWWALIIQDNVASISGCHKINETQLRCLFRSATLPRWDNLITGISKNHMNSIPFSLLLPKQIEWGLAQGYTEFLITTSHGEHDASGKMNRTHRAISLLSRRGIVEFVGEEIIYHTPQTVWRIVIDSYMQAIQTFNSVNSLARKIL